MARRKNGEGIQYMPCSARERFDRTREAVNRLHEVQLMIMNGCEDWRPPSVAPRNAQPDPTAARAIRNVDELEGRLSALRAEESELVDFIGETLVIIRAVREGLGDKYADILEWRFIDCMNWGYIRDEYDVATRTGYRNMNIALDWIDSIGITRIIAGDLDV